jgi:hypothetical protein
MRGLMKCCSYAKETKSRHTNRWKGWRESHKTLFFYSGKGKSVDWPQTNFFA